MQKVYRGYIIRVASPTGGKAGKGGNKTSSVSIVPAHFPADGKSAFHHTTIRFNVHDLDSFRRAIKKAHAWVDARTPAILPEAK